MSNILEKKNWYQKQFRAFEEGLNGQRNSPIHDLRKQALEQFMAIEFPTAKNEDWKYTNIEPVLSQSFETVNASDQIRINSKDIERFFIADTSARLVFIDGRFSPNLSQTDQLPKGIKVKNLSRALAEDKDAIHVRLKEQLQKNKDVFAALNTAFLLDGLFISASDRSVIDQPIYILYLASSESKSTLIQPYNLITVGKNARIAIVENYASMNTGSAFTNSYTNISIAAEGSLDLLKIQQENVQTCHIGLTEIHQDRASRLTHRIITSGGALVRNVVNLNLDAEGIESTLDGIYLTTGTQHVDNRTIIHHAKPNCNSHELYKGILDGKSSGVFNGKIIVHQDAQKTDAKQSNKNLLLSQDATMNTKPQLEIFADDVKCTHGATIGRLEDESLFYLRTRGIGKAQAKNMLTYAFAGEIVERIKHEPTRNYLDGLLLDRLEH
jgi:Fe-S cluster assembly protein SufD